MDCAGVEQLTVEPVESVSGTVVLPGSKSLSNRTLLLAALAEGTTKIENLLVGAVLYPFVLLHVMKQMLKDIV